MKCVLTSSLVLAFAASAASVAPARGADLPARTTAPAAPLPTFAFEGFYLGGQIGVAGTADRLRDIYSPTGATLASKTIHGGGVIGGLRAGYDWRYGSMVLGVVGDIDGARAVSSGTTIFGENIKQVIGVQGSLRGRVGYAFDHLLVYATGGLFLADVSRQYRAAFLADDQNHIAVGPTLGVGAEYALDDHWRANIEYRVNGLATRREYVSPIYPGAKLRQTGGEGEIKLGVSYRFGN